MNIVGYYRRRLDEAMANRGQQRSSSGTSRLGFVPNPNKTFNRGYTTYFLTGRGSAVASPSTPKHVGEPIGHILGADSRSITIDSNQPLHRGDGITYFNKANQLDGSMVNEIEGNRLFLQRPTQLSPGTRVFRNHDQAFVSQLNKATPKRTMGVRLVLKEIPQGIALFAEDEDGIEATATLNEPFEPAQDAALATHQTLHHLAKLGDTIFHKNDILLEWNLPRFIPVAKINGLRRQVVDALLTAREKARIRPSKPRAHTHHPFPTFRLTFTGNVLNSKAADFYRRHGVSAIEPACEHGHSLAGRVVMTTKFCLQYELGYCPKMQPKTIPPLPWMLVDDEGRCLPLRFRCDRADCVMEVFYGIGDDSKPG
jgi:putative protease